MSLWLVMIVLHAVSGVVCFAAGLAIVSPRRARQHRWLLPAFLVSLAGLIVFMVGAMASHWYDISAVEKVLFSGLTGLALYMFYRALNARRLLRADAVPGRYIDDVGFTLISLFNGFIIVALIDLGAPAWLVVLGAVVAAVVGARMIKQTKKRYRQSAL